MTATGLEGEGYLSELVGCVPLNSSDRGTINHVRELGASLRTAWWDAAAPRQPLPLHQSPHQGQTALSGLRHGADPPHASCPLQGYGNRGSETVCTLPQAAQQAKHRDGT